MNRRLGLLAAVGALLFFTSFAALAQTQVNQPPGPIPGADCTAGQSITGWPAYGTPFNSHCGNGVASGVINTGTVGNFAVYTGTTTTSTVALTQGSLPYAGSGGAASQDNGNLFYNPTGYSAGPLHQIGPRGSQSAPDAVTQIYSATVGNGILSLHQTGTQNSTTGGAIQLLEAMPAGAAVALGNRLGSLGFGGSTDVSNDQGLGAAISGFATQLWTPTNTPASLKFFTVPNGTTTQTLGMTLGQDQSLLVAGTITATGGFPSPALSGTPSAPTPATADSSTLIATTAHVKAQGFTLGSTPLTLASGTVGTIAGLTLTAPTINGGAMSGTITGSPTFTGLALTSPTLSNPTISGTATFTGNASFASGMASATLTNAPLLGTDVSGNFRAITLGSNLALSGTTLNASGGSGGSVTWPPSGGLLVSNSTNSPQGLAPVNNDLLYATGGAWTTLSTAASSVLCTDASSVPSLCSSATMQTLLGYLTGNQTTTLSGDASGSGTTSIAVTNTKVNGVAYGATPATNTVPVVTGSNQITYLTGSGLSGQSGFGSMLTQASNNVAITGGSITGTTISGSSNTITNIANASLTNSSMTLAGHSVALGGTQTFAIGDLSNINDQTIVGNNSGGAGVPLALTTTQIKTMLSLGTLSTQNANALNVTGVTALTGLPACSGASDACPKSYIDAAVTGAILHTQVMAATAAALPNTPVVASGTGVGKTLTAAANAALVVDGYTVLLNDRVLVKNQAAPADNGIYTQTTLGVGGSVKWVLTRATDFDQAAAGEVALGAYMFVANGTVNAGAVWQLGAPTPVSITVDTTSLTFNMLSTTSNLSADGTTILNTGGVLSALPNGILSAITATPNSLLARGASTWAGVAPVNNAVLSTNGSGVPSESTTLPSGLTIPAPTMSGTVAGNLTFSGSLTLNGALSGTGLTNYFSSPSAIGNTVASSGAFTTLSASSTVSGTGFSTYLASPPAIGGTVAAAGAFTTLSASSTVSGTGFSTYLASPPAIGGTAAAAGSFTTLSASSTVSGTGFSTYLASPPAIGLTVAAAAKFTTLGASSTVTLTGLASGTQVSCLGLNASNQIVLLTSACGAGASTGDTVTTGVAAAGTTLAAATDLTTQQNYVATGANCTTYPNCIPSAGVRLDAALMVAGNHVYVTNEDPSNALLVYPDTTGHTINNQGAGVAIAVQANQTALLIVKSATALRTVP